MICDLTIFGKTSSSHPISPVRPSVAQKDSPLMQYKKKRNLRDRLSRTSGLFLLIPYAYMLKTLNSTGSSNPAQDSSSRFSQASHHVPAPDVIEISDSDEPDSSQFTGRNQASVSFPAPSLASRTEVIELFSSDAEDAPQSPTLPPPPSSSMPQMLPGRPRQSPEGLDISNSPSTPPQVSSSPQLPTVSSPHEVEEMMVALSSPTTPPNPSNPFESVEDSEPEGVAMEETCDVDDPQAVSVSPVEDTLQNPHSDDEPVPPPPPTSSSISPHTPISRHPTPTVRYILYGGPNGIFRDANASLLQHIQSAANQDALLSSFTPPLSTPMDREAEIQPPPTMNAVSPVSGPAPRPETPLVSNVVFSPWPLSSTFFRYPKVLRQLT